ncbi:hypothetical protein [Dyadobacter sp. Leaf189]|uniref:hypothetical protein n=1 Tax=Dyadobacter sp. Leaf189 TaxID=1736295 RepID=UPI0006F23DC9|nr:hypothetical protein [Dyadobacter sp. Leaf189]KQS28030.1 hypothetical protein ASG33_16710 [Dyadobacter sp. Leaf189]
MKNTHLVVAISIALLATANESFSQNKPAPTGQVPRAYSGQQQGTSSYSGYQPRPTGQIAPAVAGQSPANLPRPANLNQVQNLGFEPAKADVTAEGQVPKVNSNQDPRTFPERYQSTTTTPVEQTVTVQGTQVVPVQGGQQIIPGQTTQTSITTQTTTEPGTQPVNAQPGQVAQPAPAGNTQPVQRSPNQISTQPQTQAPAAGAPKRMEP